MRKTLTTAAVAALVVACAARAEAGLFGRRAAVPAPTACYGGSCGASYSQTLPAAYVGQTPLYNPVYTVPTPAAVPAPAPAPALPYVDPTWVSRPQPTAPVAAAAGAPSALAGDYSPAGFLAALNAYRAMAGRPALSWDSSLAGWGAANSIWPHGTTAPGAGQCSARTTSYQEALRQWINSPPHQAILLGATTCIGVSPCAFGMTANAK